MPKGYFMNTISGGKFWPMDPQIEDLNLSDITHALSLTCRFNGHVPDLYSVAQHSFILSRIVPFEHVRWALMHDAAEAYLNDMVTAVKMGLPSYRRVEKAILRLVAKKYGLPSPLPPLAVKMWDYALSLREADVLGVDRSDWIQPYEILPEITKEIKILPPEEVREKFTEMLRWRGIHEPSEEQDE